MRRDEAISEAIFVSTNKHSRPRKFQKFVFRRWAEITFELRQRPGGGQRRGGLCALKPATSAKISYCAGPKARQHMAWSISRIATASDERKFHHPNPFYKKSEKVRKLDPYPNQILTQPGPEVLTGFSTPGVMTCHVKRVPKFFFIYSISSHLPGA